jgi:trk system potassium uptake protein TrkH
MRHRALLRRLYGAILAYTGLVYIITGGALMAPLLALPFYPGEADQAWAFLLPGGALALLGTLLWYRFAPDRAVTLGWQDGAVVVLLAWIGAITAASAVFMLAHGLNLTQAVFEATSGWTTTGLSVIDVTRATHLVLLLRSVLQLAGGAGLAIIMLSTLAGPVGAGVSSAEGRGDQLWPHVRRSASLVLALYAGYNVVGTVALWAAGMSFFDAVNHAMAAVSTGGFSTRVESIGYWDSPIIEAITIVLMIVGTLNFLTAWTLFRGKLRSFARNGEVRLMALLFPLGALVVLLSAGALYPSLGKAARVAIFEVVTAGSTTGFSTVGYLSWPALSILMLIFFMLIGGGTGSTAGGVKQYRVYVLFRALWWEIQRRFLPASAVTAHALWVGEQRRFLDDAQVRDAAVFVFTYTTAYFLGVAVLAGYGNTLSNSLFEFASALGTVGLSVGVSSADAPGGLLWTETIGMFLGRLEFFAVFAALFKVARDGSALLDRTPRPN